MGAQEPQPFNDWLRSQLKAKRMSQRQLAQQSGVDHSTISRLIRGDRTPSLDTATKLARGLREIRDEGETPWYFGQMSNGTSSPPARVEYALRSDEILAEPNVRQVMEYYLSIRMRRLSARSPLALRALAGHVSNPAPNGNPGTGGSPVPRQRP